MLAEPGNPYGGHTLGRIIEQVQRITGCAVKRGFVDRGYRGHTIQEVPDTHLWPQAGTDAADEARTEEDAAPSNQ